MMIAELPLFAAPTPIRTVPPLLARVGGALLLAAACYRSAAAQQLQYLPPGDPAALPAAIFSPPAHGADVLPLEATPSAWSEAVALPGEQSVLERLEQAEATIAAMQARLAMEEATPEPDSVFGFLGDRWRTAGDPELEIIAYQTSSSAGSGESKPWYEKLSIRGYTQFRINSSVWEDDLSAPPHHTGDRSVSENQNFLIRRARLILSGNVSEHMYVYLQPDFAVTPPGSPDANHFTQIRDWYADLYLDVEKVFRFRLGQSKVPYGWENLQSSSNRIPLDRSDPLNSAVRNERDLGVFFYWTPVPAQDFFKSVLDQGLKGSGNYGVFGIGAYDGQGGSFVEQNDNMHLVARLTLPMVLENGQMLEVGAQAYTGRYTVLSSAISPLGVGAAVRPAGTLETGNQAGIRDERVAGTVVWYPQPLGFQAEWNVGRGPGLNHDQTEVSARPLYGGYAMTMCRLEGPCQGVWFPFLRWNYYRGGYKPERNAPFSLIDEWETGIEWQINPQMEFNLTYAITDRTNTSAVSQADQESYGQYDGQLLRFQFQVNY